MNDGPNIKIRLARKDQARDCLACVEHSELWKRYFESMPDPESHIHLMIAEKQIHVALNETGNCIGFMGVIHNGCFRKFSYLSLIAVKESHRSKGVGRKLLGTFERIGFEKADRVFLLVSDFNTNAQRFYQRLGYQKVGEIPDLFKTGISEHVMIKYNNQES